MGNVGCGGRESPVRKGVRDVGDARDGWRAVGKAIGREIMALIMAGVPTEIPSTRQRASREVWNKG